MEDAHATYSTRRYILVAMSVAVLAILGIVLLTALVTAVEGKDASRVRIDSPRIYGPEGKPQETRNLTLAIAPVLTPEGHEAGWAELATYLESKLDIEITLVYRRNYGEIEGILEGPSRAIALVGSASYVRLRQRGAVRLLAVPRLHGADDYRALIIVPVDSDAQSIEQLRGRSFAFSDPLSSSGAFYPRALLAKLGTTAQLHFSRTTFTHSHDRSVRAVAAGLIDGAAVHELVYSALAAIAPSTTRRVRVIQTSPAFGMNPLVANQRIPRALFDQLSATLLAMSDDERGREILASLAIDEWVPGNPAAYRSVETMLKALEP